MSRAIRGIGSHRAPYLIRRSDRQIVEVTHLLYLLASMVDGARHSDEIGTPVSTALGRQISTADIDHLVSSKNLSPRVDGAGGAPDTSTVRPLVSEAAARRAVVPAVTGRKAAAVLRPLFPPPVIVAAIASLPQWTAGCSWATT